MPTAATTIAALADFNARAAKVDRLAGALFGWDEDRGYHVRFASGKITELGLRHDAEDWLTECERETLEGDDAEQIDEDTADEPTASLTYDFLGVSWAAGVEIDPGDLLLQGGRYACVWRVRAPMPYEDGGRLGYVAELVEEGASALVYTLDTLRADGVSGPNGGPIVGVYGSAKLSELRSRVAEKLARHTED
jgi:hypothetical protein